MSKTRRHTLAKPGPEEPSIAQTPLSNHQRKGAHKSGINTNTKSVFLTDNPSPSPRQSALKNASARQSVQRQKMSSSKQLELNE